MLQTELRVGEAAALSIAKTAPQRADLSQEPAAPLGQQYLTFLRRHPYTTHLVNLQDL
jgi:hypothetical protein